MLKNILLKVWLMLGAGVASLCFALTPVDVNKADQAALDGVKGIGPATAQAILDERKRAGPFKDWNDLSARVKGIGDKRSANLSKAGLTVNGQSKANAPVATVAKADVKPVPAGSAAVDGKHAKAEHKK